MEVPLLTKNKNNVDDDVAIHGDSSSNDEHIVDITTINGDASSTDERTVPHEAVQSSDPSKSSVWILVEFVVTLVQIVAAMFFLTLTKDKQNTELEVALFAWIIVYTVASIYTLFILCWRLWHYYYQTFSSETSIDDDDDNEEEVIDFYEMMLQFFFVVLIVIFLLIFLTEISTCTTQHFWLWMALLASSCIRYVLPNCAVRFFSWPMAFCLEFFWKFFVTITGAVVEGFRILYH